MLKRIASISFAVCLSAACCLNFATAQDTLAIGQIEYSDQSDVIIVGQSDTVLDHATASLVEFADDFGNVDYGYIEIENDGRFMLSAPAYTARNSSLVLIGKMAEPGHDDDALVVFLAIDTAVESKKIGEGHAFDKHVNGVGGPNGKEFENGKIINGLAFPDATITTKTEFADFIKDIMDNPDHTKQSGNGVKTYYFDDGTGTLVIYDPNNGDNGTAFRPTNGKTYYDNNCN